MDVGNRLDTLTSVIHRIWMPFLCQTCAKPIVFAATDLRRRFEHVFLCLGIPDMAKVLNFSRHEVLDILSEPRCLDSPEQIQN